MKDRAEAAAATEKRAWKSHAAGALSLATIPLVGLLDWWTGPDIGVSLFYLVPIAVTAWHAGRGWMFATVIAASNSWFVAELLASGSMNGYVVWNGFTRVVIYSALAVLLGAVRTERGELRVLNRRLEEALEMQRELARTDSTTKLANARSFAEELASRLAEGAPLCVIFVDLDDFKVLNDRYGHLAGDQALWRVGSTMRSAVRRGEGEREEDLVARLGGDEFGILLSGIGADGALLIAERIIACIADLREQYPLTRLGASAGVACAVAGDGPDELIRRADDAMYRAKAAGKGRVAVG